jgi:hypothetical protein
MARQILEDFVLDELIEGKAYQTIKNEMLPGFRLKMTTTTTGDGVNFEEHVQVFSLSDTRDIVTLFHNIFEFLSETDPQSSTKILYRDV